MREQEPTLDAPVTAAAAPSLDRGAPVGRYLILSVLGRGGMGEVYAAYDPELDRRVALKLLHAAHGSESARRRLVREARALGKLSHPNVVQVHDVGEHRGDVFVAMELVEGESFDAWCSRAPRPAWREVLAAYLDAARGLSAAHEGGLVHRDVKPANMLRGHDGRVRVADFGLAAGREEVRPREATPAVVASAAGEATPLGETMPAPSRRGGHERLTAAGAVMGTPLYMAPEQHRGPDVSPACDQYSLCVALHEGLYGEAPFRLGPSATQAEMLADLLAQKQKGAPASPPAGTPVPAWVYRALARGLLPLAEDRYPSLTALIAALSEDPGARRRARWRRAGLGAAAAALVAVAAAGWAKSGALESPCAHRERELGGVWDEGVKGGVRAALAGTGRSYAGDTATRVAALLDRYAATWISMRAEVCEAARGGQQRRELASLRDACLDRRRGQLHALTTLFAERSDPEVLDRAVQAAAGLYPVAICADTEALTARVHPPEDPALRARVAALEPRVDRLGALHAAGKYQEGLALGEPLLAEVAGLPYAPLRAQVEYWVGRLLDGTGQYDRADTLLEAAVISAAEGHDDVLAVNAWAQLLYLTGHVQQRFAEASMIRALGPSAVVRAHDDLATATWLNAESVAVNKMGKQAEGRALAEASLALREKVLGPDHLDVATSLNNLGSALMGTGDYRKARVVYERALRLREDALGPDHPDVANSLNNVGFVLRYSGDYPGAKAALERAVSIREKALGPDHDLVGQALSNLGCALVGLGDHARATAVLERALAISEKGLGADNPDVAFVLLGLARARMGLNHPEEARSLLDRAWALSDKVLAPSHPDRADPLLGLGELALASGKPREAAVLLERALSFDNPLSNADIQLTLAEALWQVGEDRARARVLAEKARGAYERIGHQTALEKATRWLGEHAG